MEDEPRVEVELRPAERPRGEEDRELADSEAAADQRLERRRRSSRRGHWPAPLGHRSPPGHRPASPPARLCAPGGRCSRRRAPARPPRGRLAAPCGYATPLIGRTLARYRLAGPFPASPFQTVRAHFEHTAYRWSLGVMHAQRRDSVPFRTSDRARAPKTSRTTSRRPLRADTSASRGVERETARAVVARSGRSG